MKITTSQDLHKIAMQFKHEMDLINVSEQPAQYELLHAQYITAWQQFEDLTWQECKLPRLELLIKRANFG